MTSDLDVYRTASVLIREHGDEADLVARARPDPVTPEHPGLPGVDRSRGPHRSAHARGRAHSPGDPAAGRGGRRRGRGIGPVKSYQQFFAELRRWRVFRVMAGYGIIGFGIIEAAEAIFPRVVAARSRYFSRGRSIRPRRE